MTMLNFTCSLNDSLRNNSGRNVLELYKSSERELTLRITMSVINAFLCLTTIFGNSAILIGIWKTSSLHSVTNILLANLAVSDLAVGLVGQPLFVVFFFFSGNEAFGLLVNIFGTIFCSTSFFTIAAISVDRLLALHLHLRYEAVVTPFRATWVVISIWVLSGILTLTKLKNARVSTVASSALSICTLFGNFVVYLKIYLIVRRHQRQIQRQQQEASNENIFSVKRFRKSALNSFSVFIFLFCCNTPYSVAIIIHLTGEIISPSFYIAAVTLICLNSSLNPLLFCWRYREIRTAVKQLFWYGC